MEVIHKTKSDFLRNILGMKMEVKLKEFTNEDYYLMIEDGVIHSISRVIKLTDEEIKNEFFKKFKINLPNSKEIYFFDGLWVSYKHRKLGLAKSLIAERATKITYDDMIISIVKKPSNLVPFYLEKYNMKIVFEDENNFYIKNYSYLKI